MLYYVILLYWVLYFYVIKMLNNEFLMAIYIIYNEYKNNF